MGSARFLQNCISWASLALLYYDYALTFSKEVRYIWGKRICLSNVAYVGCRYALVANVLFLLAKSNKLGLGVSIPLIVTSRLWDSNASLNLVRFCRGFSKKNPLMLVFVSCDVWYKIIAGLAVLGRASVIVTFTARTYAVYCQNRFVLAYLAALGLATVITDAMHVPAQQCVNSRSTPM
ncbi:hypothetical protein PM082_010379 [Marasmius tenuissimus]|nr:hypothetical protein PM082_010379 [Marasmius tenuissimus]